MENLRIKKAKYLLHQAEGDEKKMLNAISRVRAMLASIAIGRRFNQDIEEYINTKPEIKQFRDWAKNIEISEDYKLIEK